MPTFVYNNFEWDIDKNSVNIQKHDIDFHLAILIFSGEVIEREFLHSDTAEVRRLTVGLLFGKEITVISTMRGLRIRVISARRARKNEREEFKRNV